MSMKWYIGRRILWAVFAVWVVLTITFALMYIAPDANMAEFQFEQAMEGVDPDEAQEIYERQRGLDRPVFEQYRDYMLNFITFNWGWSHGRSQTVMDVLADAYPYSLMYGVPSVIISTVLGLMIGLYSATHQYTRTDYAATFFAFFGLSIPNFWFAIILLLVFGVWLGWAPVHYQTNVPVWSWENLHQNILPIVVLTTASIAGMMRYSRAEALEYVEAEFVKTAKAKGASHRTILYKHIFRPAAVPLSTILVSDLLSVIFIASYLVEVVFGIPGLGLVSYLAILDRDTALVLATVLIPAFIAIIGNLMQDIVYTILDPRIDYGDR